jgi:chromosome segregation ATPase
MSVETKGHPSVAGDNRTSEEELAFAETEGISEEDRKEVAAQIEQIALQSRIKATPELFQFKGKRKSGTLPLVANIFGIVLMAAGVLGGYFLFQRQEAEIADSVGTFTTAEGRLIAEIRRQAQEELQSKDSQITTVQRELTDVRVERDQILAEIDARVQEREEALRLQLAEELEAERARLLAQGISELNVEQRIESLEASRSAENRAELAEYRQELQAEYETTLNRLRQLQQQYEDELAALQRERLAIAEESETREQEVREEIERRQVEAEPVSQDAVSEDPEQAAAAAARAAELEAQDAALESARAQLAQLTASAEQEALVEAQISGLYADIADEVSVGNYEAALSSITTLRRLLREPAIAQLPGVQERIDVDLAVIRVLEELVIQQRLAIAAAEEAARIAAEQATAEQAQGAGGAADTAADPDTPQQDEAAPAAANPAVSDEQVARLTEELSARERLVGSLEAELQQLRSELLAAEQALRDQRRETAEARAAATAAANAATERAATAPNAAAAGPEGPSQQEEALAADVAALRVSVGELEAANQRLENQNAELSTRIEQLTEQARQLGSVAARYRALVARYRQYVEEENQILSNDSIGALAQAKLELDGFLTSDAVSAAFPNLFDRVSRYERAIEVEAGQRAILELVDLVYNLNALDTPEAKQAYLDRERQRADDQGFMADLLVEMGYLVGVN